MRISTMQIFRQGLSAMLDQQSQAAKIQQQLATGKRIVKPSDDPTGAAQLVGLSEASSVTNQYQRNILTARTTLELEDAVLASVADNLQRARELAVQGLNSTNSAQDRASIALEIRQIKDEVLALANRTNGSGRYLFSGFQVLTSPFSETAPGVFNYAGDQGQRQIQIGASRRVTDGDDGQSVFMDIPDGSGGSEDVFTTLSSLAVSLEANTPNGSSLDQIDNALDHIIDFRASVGARLNSIDSQTGVNESLLVQLEDMRSNLEDIDLAEAASRLNQQSITLQAAQQAFIKVHNLTLFNYL